MTLSVSVGQALLLEIWGCYITYNMDFQFVPSDPVCFDKLSRCDE